MPAITATAPGKIILFGEHAVVYGQPAIAVPVSQVRARAVITANPREQSGWIHVQAPDIGLDDNWKSIPQDHPLIAAINGVLETVGIEQTPALTIRITSTIPVAAGLGSGAAVSVAIIRALSEFLGRPLGRQEISHLAYEVDKLHHGTPSGIDNTVITYEKPIYFIKEGFDHPGTQEVFQVSKPFVIVIADTGIPSPTSQAVGDVRASWQKDKITFETLFERAGEIASQARTALTSGDNSALGPLMNANQVLLEQMGVSSEKLERLIQTALEAGAPGAKLSGGGRGGNMIALVKDDSARNVAEALQAAGAASTIITTVSSQNQDQR